MFKVTRQTLDVMERKGELTVSDVGGLFRDLFNDILEEQKTAFSDLPTGDSEEAAGDLIMIMQQMRKLHRKNEEIFSQERYRDRWENATRGLEEAEKELEKILNEAKQHEDTALKISKVKEKCEAAKRDLDDTKREYEQAEKELEILLQEKQDVEALLEEKKKESGHYLQDVIPACKQELDQAEWNLKQERQAYEKLQGQLKQKVDELVRLRQLWDKVMHAYTRDQELFPADAGADRDLVGSMQDRYSRIREELETFRQDYANAAGILRR